MDVYNELPRNHIKDLNDWNLMIMELKKVCFQNFSQALSFIVQVGILARNKVTIELFV
jgi:pterin-4a-carbinolamine dehydratase